MMEFFEFLTLGQPVELANAFLGALLGALSSVAGAFGGGGNSAQIKASVQNNKLNAATQKANEASRLRQRSDEVAVAAKGQKAELEQAALAQLVEGFRQSLLNNMRF